MSSRSRPAHRRQGARHRRSRRHPRPDRHRSHLGVRLCPGHRSVSGSGAERARCLVVRQIADLVPSHVVSVPDANVTIGKKCDTLPVEVVVRGRLSGSTSTALWTQYDAGARTIYGLDFPDGMQKNDPLPEAIITPTTKAEQGGHDEPITELEIVERGIVDAELWDQSAHRCACDLRTGTTDRRRGGSGARRHQVRVRSRRRRDAHDHRRGPHPGLVRYWRASTVEERRAAGDEPRTSTRNTFGSPTCATATTRSPNHGRCRSNWHGSRRRLPGDLRRPHPAGFEPAGYPAAERVTAALFANHG